MKWSPGIHAQFCHNMSNSTIQYKPDLSMAKTYPGGDRNFWKGCQLFETLEWVGEDSGVATVGAEVPVHWPLCPGGTSYLGVWVWGD